MADDGHNYKREEDREWRRNVDHQLMTAITAIQVLNQKQAKLEDEFENLDERIRGDGTPGDTGMTGMLVEHDDKIRQMYAVVIQDSTGKKGVLHDIDYLMGRKKYSEVTSSNRWTFAGTVVGVTVGAIATITVALLSIDPVRTAIGRYLETHFSIQITALNSKPAPVKKSGKPKPRVKRIVAPEPTAPELPPIGHSDTDQP